MFVLFIEAKNDSNAWHYFETTFKIPRIKVGQKQTIETLINEEAFLLAQYLRQKKQAWKHRISIIARLENSTC